VRFRRRRLTKKHTFGLLMAASLLALLIPGRYTRPLKNPLQLLAPMQWAVHGTAACAQQSASARIRPSVSAEKHEQLQYEKNALENRVASMGRQMEEMEQIIGAISGWRQRGLAANTCVIPARVVAGDSVGWRESIVVDRGSSDGVQVGDWVATHGSLSQVGDASRTAQVLLASECLLGRVVETSPLTSRVVLLSDGRQRQPTRVRVARVEENRLAGPSDDLTLYGLGNAKMSIPDVPAQLLETSKIREQDLVISSPTESRLPLAMVIGRIERIEKDRKNPLLLHVFVTPRADTSCLQQVYIISSSPKNQ